MNTVRDEWDGYARDVLPKDANAIQVQETRRAFYAGALAMQTISLRAAASLSDDAYIALMNSLDDELEAFSKSIGTPQEGQACNLRSTTRAGSKPA